MKNELKDYLKGLSKTSTATKLENVGDVFSDSNNNNTFVPMRRRLSGGKVDQYIGRDQDNNMDGMDIDANRPRSMSF